MAAAVTQWEHFDHGADIGVRGIGRTAAQAFEQAALALTAVVTDPANVQLHEVRRLECEAADLEALFYQWLNAVMPSGNSLPGQLKHRTARRAHHGAGRDRSP